MGEKIRNLGIIVTEEDYKTIINAETGGVINMKKLLDADVNRTFQSIFTPGAGLNRPYGWVRSFGAECVTLIQKIALYALKEKYNPKEYSTELLSFTFNPQYGLEHFAVRVNIWSKKYEKYTTVLVLIYMDGKIQITESEDDTIQDKMVDQIWFDLRNIPYECQPIGYNLKINMGVWSLDTLSFYDPSIWDFIYNNFSNPIMNAPRCDNPLSDYFTMESDPDTRKIIISIGPSRYIVEPDLKLAFAYTKIWKWLFSVNNKWIVLGFRFQGFKNVCIALRTNNANKKEGFILVINDQSIDQIIVLNDRRSTDFLNNFGCINDFVNEAKQVEIV